jgi:hypothetical protein
MKTHTGWVALTCLLVAGLAHADDTDLQKFTSKDLGFTVLLPGKPMETTQEVKSGAGPLTVHLFVQAPSKDVAYVVGVNDYPDAFVKGKTADKVLDDGTQGGIKTLEDKGLHPRKTSEKKITLGEDKHPGRDIRIDIDKGVYRTRIYLVGSRLYQVTLVGPETVVTGKDADRYFDSFEVTR